ncbi:MAG: NAD(P)-dependent alcohol dehydrogenase [Cytophagia bacterium]|nr:NAD(P)-dependent alcohol dehydrogenase [Cytophagia bacterium]
MVEHLTLLATNITIGEYPPAIKATTVTMADFRVRSFTVPLSFWIPARLMLGITKPRNPVLGVELSGEIDMVGSKVANFKVGDEVYAATLQNMGAYAEYICLPATAAIAHKPASLSFEEAAAIPTGACTALYFLRKSQLQRGQHVLIYGASGSVGTYAVQLAKHFGAIVTAVCSAANSALVKSLGADEALDYQHPDFIKQLKQYDVVFVAVDKIPFQLCEQILKPKGVYINVNTPLRTPTMVWTTLIKGKKTIGGEKPNDTAEDLQYLNDLIAKGELKVVVDSTYPLDEIRSAHRYVDQGRKRGNVCIRIG